MRLRQDHKLNTLPYSIVEQDTGEIVDVMSYELKVGDLVYLREGDQIPMDLLCLASSDKGVCYMETSALDGETNLKPISTPDYTSKMSTQELSQLKGTIECESPNHKLYNFRGVINLDNGEPAIPLSEKNLLLMGSKVKNTEWAIGVGIYAGPETKMCLNQKKPPSKLGHLDLKLNRYVFALFAINFTCCIIMSSLNMWWSQKPEAIEQHLTYTTSGAFNFFSMFLSYFALLNYLVPLSMVVTLEVARFIQAQFMNVDKNMKYGDRQCDAKTSNLNDELALVEYVFSDKTGTLTENIMKFKEYNIQGVSFTIEDDKTTFDSNIVANVDEFFLAMSLCHSSNVSVDKTNNSILYQSVSPDDEALCYGASEYGYAFQGKEENMLKVLKDNNEDLQYRLLIEIPFSSDRKRMSVIVQMKDGKVVMFTKGADSMIEERLSKSQHNIKHLPSTAKQLKKYSEDGLRTLLFAKKEFETEEWEKFYARWMEASSTIEGRDEALFDLSEEIETNLELLGASAVEDKLQHGVPESIQTLLKAGIKVWMITGDKQETAINIGYSTRLLTSSMNVIKLNYHNDQMLYSTLNNLNEKYTDIEEEIALVVDGATLSLILSLFRNEFRELAKKAGSVICNRVTPLQKAEIVNLIKSDKNICLSIGDGGNDVSMIQMAHIGVGIQGREGNQASRAADFSIPQFEYITRLLLVHGRYSILRNSKVIYYSFYKNIATFLPQIWFSFFSGFSAQTLYNEWTMMLYNVLITSLPIFIVGLFEQDLDQNILVKYPHVYRSHKNLKFWSLVKWLSYGIYHSLVCFFFTYCLLSRTGSVINTDGRGTGNETLGAMIITYSILVITCKLALEIVHWVIFTFFSIIISLTVYLLARLSLSYMPVILPSQVGLFAYLFSSPVYYFAAPVILVACLLPDFIFKHVKRMDFPKLWYIIQERSRFSKFSSEEEKSLEKPLLYSSEEEDFVD